MNSLCKEIKDLFDDSRKLEGQIEMVMEELIYDRT